MPCKWHPVARRLRWLVPDCSQTAPLFLFVQSLGWHLYAIYSAYLLRGKTGLFPTPIPIFERWAADLHGAVGGKEWRMQLIWHFILIRGCFTSSSLRCIRTKHVRIRRRLHQEIPNTSKYSRHKHMDHYPTSRAYLPEMIPAPKWSQAPKWSPVIPR